MQNVSSVGGKTTAQGFSFLATAQGSFASALYAATLLESLPVPSSMQEINFTHAMDMSGTVGGNTGWQLNAQVQILSASNPAS